jgi:hypothetical protein
MNWTWLLNTGAVHLPDVYAQAEIHCCCIDLITSPVSTKVTHHVQFDCYGNPIQLSYQLKNSNPWLEKDIIFSMLNHFHYIYTFEFFLIHLKEIQHIFLYNTTYQSEFGLPPFYDAYLAEPMNTKMKVFFFFNCFI